MSSIKELILRIRDKPGLYINQNSISCLKAYLDGWTYRNPETIDDIEIINDFQEWIQSKYKVKGTQSWARILLFFSVDEFNALQLFFKEFDLFLNEGSTSE